ncbi:hypothetical protein BLGI_770 [Brevibacillus laterosporus GI-9]|nr:hypothetical protein BLGI_770 [Brevibacillus laterosporus GI-9]
MIIKVAFLEKILLNDHVKIETLPYSENARILFPIFLK